MLDSQKEFSLLSGLFAKKPDERRLHMLLKLKSLRPGTDVNERFTDLDGIRNSIHCARY